MNDSIKTLSRTPRPAKKTLGEIADMNGRIAVLENQLGLAHCLPTLNSQRAQARLAELETLAAKTPLPAPVVAVAPAAVVTPPAPVVADAMPADVKPLREFLALAPDARRQFCQDGMKLSLGDYNKLNPSQRLQFAKDGGKIHEDRQPVKNSLYVGGQFQT
jgi:hypothetical protein